MLATLAQLEAQALADRAQAVAQAAEYLAGTRAFHRPPPAEPAPFPERMHILALIGRFTLDHTALVAEWARWDRAEVEQSTRPGGEMPARR